MSAQELASRTGADKKLVGVFAIMLKDQFV